MGAQEDTGLANSDILGLAFNGENMFAGTITGDVYLSTDSGAIWTLENIGLLNGNNLVIQCLAVAGANVIAGTNNGLFISTDNGTTWIENNDFTYSYPMCYSFVCFAVSGANIFAGAFYENIFQGARFIKASIYPRIMAQAGLSRTTSLQIPIFRALPSTARIFYGI